ncbi:SRPBCC family protein [Streptomyces bambusae]|uniref:SRPBCC family protein n=1 Tax=Streptomyces bambusae TaxID=1550616 RepID=UPI001CFD5917|nr:SRPBCC family protein [Streptomyces bambusae]MCB5163495.1 SRPBCC family protein [Streptomyces bambusae]
MEHQVFVPVPAENLRAVLRDPERVARCVPGLQRDAESAAGPAGSGPGPLAGRLRIRVGGSTVTYRGVLHLAERDPDTFEVTGEGTEARGTGTVKLALTVSLRPVEGGTQLELTATARADGRAAGFEPEAVETAGRRVLDRAAGHLSALAAADLQERPGSASAEEAGEEDAADAEGPDVDDEEFAGSALFGTEVPPPSLDPFIDDEFSEAVRPPAEAAHARRTMIGRSAEEVDHAPPRGRYAPVPGPDVTSVGGQLRWLAPAAALAIASAVVAARVLRRRR